MIGAAVPRTCSCKDALDFVAGYTIVNDISARDIIQRPDWPNFASDWLESKNFDTATPIGPYLLPREFVPDPQHVRLKLTRNGVVQQDGNTAIDDLQPGRADRPHQPNRDAAARRRHRDGHAGRGRLEARLWLSRATSWSWRCRTCRSRRAPQRRDRPADDGRAAVGVGVRVTVRTPPSAAAPRGRGGLRGVAASAGAAGLPRGAALSSTTGPRALATTPTRGRRSGRRSTSSSCSSMQGRRRRSGTPNYWTLTQVPVYRYIIGAGIWLGGQPFMPLDLDHRSDEVQRAGPGEVLRSGAPTATSASWPSSAGCRARSAEVLWAARVPMVLLGAGTAAMLFLVAAELAGRRGRAGGGGRLRGGAVRADAAAARPHRGAVPLLPGAGALAERRGRARSCHAWAAASSLTLGALAGLAVGLSAGSKLTGVLALAALAGFAAGAFVLALLARRRSGASLRSDRAPCWSGPGAGAPWPPSSGWSCSWPSTRSSGRIPSAGPARCSQFRQQEMFGQRTLNEELAVPEGIGTRLVFLLRRSVARRAVGGASARRAARGRPGGGRPRRARLARCGAAGARRAGRAGGAWSADLAAGADRRDGARISGSTGTATTCRPSRSGWCWPGSARPRCVGGAPAHREQARAPRPPAPRRRRRCRPPAAGRPGSGSAAARPTGTPSVSSSQSPSTTGSQASRQPGTTVAATSPMASSPSSSGA